MARCGERVVVAMSGGVDSSVAAALLLDQGYDVVGVTVQLRDCDDPGASRSCCGAEGLVQARAVAGELGIPHYQVDGRTVFTERVLRPAWTEYARGRTPSPCLECNREIKLGLLHRYAAQLGARWVATGHYARVVDSREGPHLLRALDRSKDQAYFLSRLDPEVLSGLLLPIGGLTKTEVRAVARARGLAVADRRESQDACLRADGLGLAETLRQKFQAPARPGKMVTVGGEVLGQHPGLHRFTIGQRRGLGVALGSPAFVVGLRAQDATVVVSTDEQDLLAFGLSAEHVRWMARPCTRCEAQIRSRHDAAAGRLELENNGRARFWFDQPQRAVAPGQAVAFFAGERVLGGGWIERALGPGSASLSDIEECLGLGDP